MQLPTKKINNFKVNKSTTTKANLHIFSCDPFRSACYTEINTFRMNNGGLGAIPPEAEEFLKIKQNGDVSFIVFCIFGWAP